LYDEIMECLRSRHDIDEDHIHSVGFSSGGIVTDMLGVMRGEELASVATYSGTYFSNPANWVLGADWPDWSSSNKYTQLLLHGGTEDKTDFILISVHFDQNTEKDVGYLNGLGHDAVICRHGEGHKLPDSGVLGPQLVEFFAAHPRGQPTPYAVGLPAGFPAHCEFSPAD
ncbi:MAG: hypothetical protein ACOC1F_13615, partial [Myxococcota bacterium]